MIILRKPKELPYNQANIDRYRDPSNLLSHARFVPEKSDGIFLVTPDKDNLIGYVGWEDDWIIALEVSKDYQGKGYGDVLLGKALDAGCNGLTVRINNTKAVNLYKKHGFIPSLIRDGRMNMIKP